MELAKRMVHGIPTSKIEAQAADMVNSQVWVLYEWWWTLSTIAAIPLIDGQQDYLGVPTNFHRWIYPRIAQTNLTPVEYRELTVRKHLGVELTRKGSLETIRDVAFESSLGKFRLNFPPIIGGGTTMELQGEYQIVPTRITDANMTTPYVQPDAYYMVQVEGIKYWFYQLNDDPRAGTVVISRDGRKQYSGQLGTYYDALQTMLIAEDVADGQEFIWPEMPLGNRQNSQVWVPGL